MKKLFFLQTMRLQRKSLIFLVLLEAGRALLLAGAAFAAAKFIDGVFLQGKELSETAPVLLVLFLMLSSQYLIGLLQNHRTRRLSLQTRTLVREKLHQKLLSRQGQAQPDFQDRLLPLALEETDALDLWFSRVLPVLLGLAVTLPLLLIIAAFADPLTGLLMLITVPIAPFLLYLIGRVTREASEKEWQKLTELSSGFAELLKTLPTLKLFRQEKRMGQKVKALSEDFSAAALRVLQLSFVSAFALELITTLSIAIIAVGIGLRLLYGHLTFLTAFFVLLLTPEFYQPLRQAGTAFHGGMTAMTAEKALTAALKQADTRPADVSHEGSEGRTADKNKAEAALTAENLTFAYQGSPLPVIEHLSFCIPPKEITVIQGPSGSGKTTLLRLSAGLLAPTAGLLCWQQDGARIPADEICQYLSYVPQEPHLFNATLAENVSLTFGNECAACPAKQEQRVKAALQKVSLLDWANALPQGLSTRLGEGGQNLSQGQRKRLGLARAVYQDRPFVLLDEPTAALDSKTSAEIREALLTFAKGRTLVLVSHDQELQRLAAKVITISPVEQQNFISAKDVKNKNRTDAKQSVSSECPERCARE